MSFAQESEYRNVGQDLSDVEDKTSDDSISLNQSKQELQDTSCKSGLSNNRESPVWLYFNREMEGKLGIPICKICKTEFSKSSATSTLACHLTIHNIVALKRGKKLLNMNSHPKIEQQERTNLIVRWIICDLQLFSIIEGEEWRNMISKFDPRYQFPSRNTIKTWITEMFQNKQEEVKVTLNKILGKVVFTSDMWIASNGILALTTDNASSMVLCGPLLKERLQELNNGAFSHYRCAAHVLNLAVCHEVDLINESVIKVRSLMSYIKASQPTINNLKKLCNLKTDDETLHEKYPDEDERIDINDTLILLEPIECATRLLSASSYPMH
ncbi:9262_t:CDS:2, partial [Cetraspora pellucida]